MMYSHSVSRARNEQEERRAIERLRQERTERAIEAAKQQRAQLGN